MAEFISVQYVRHPYILSREQLALVVIDMQEPFLGVMHDRERLTANVRLLIETAGTLAVPILPTTQYAKRMGGVAPEITQSFRDFVVHAPLDKICFSCAGADDFLNSLASLNRRQVLLCGVETHICVSQTALDLIQQGYQVHVAADALSSLNLEKHNIIIERMRDSGVLPCAAEAAAYELLQEAGTPEFKAILKLVKS